MMISFLLTLSSLLSTEVQPYNLLPLNDTLMGSGIAKAKLSDGHKIYFYHLFPIYAQPENMKPFDSIIITKGIYHFEISYAPPWFAPESVKLDYDMLLLRATTVSKDWMEVIVNQFSGLTYWVIKEDFDFSPWPEFLLNIYSVELNDPKKNPVRVKPLDHASILATPPERFSLKPLAINGDWMMVETNGLADRIPPTGWIRWRRDDKLLIRYSLLS